MHIIVYSESFWKTLWGEFSALRIILTRVYIFHSEVQIHIDVTLQFRFAKLKADHFAHMTKSTMYEKSCIKRGDALPRKVTLKTVSIHVFNRVFIVITHVCTFAEVDGQVYSYDVYWYISEQSVVIHMRLAYHNIHQSLTRPTDWVGQYQMNVVVRICISPYIQNHLGKHYEESFRFLTWS